MFDETCPICSGNNKMNCKPSDVVYELECKKCNEIYIRETSDSIEERTSEDLYASRLKSGDSIFHKYFVQKHNSKENELKCSIIETCFEDAMLRQCTESVATRDFHPTLNSREGWGSRNITYGRK